MLNTALHYKSLGLSVLGCRDKRPVMGSWLAYKSDIASDADLSVMFTERNADQIACICGAVSGNLEIIDVDTKNDPTGKLWDELWDAIVDYFKQPPPFLITATPSGGYHIVYRCEDHVEGNQKLASRQDGKKKLSTIETRGEGGYFITSPSPGYKTIFGSIDAIPVITPEVRNDLLDICRTFNQVFKTAPDKPKSKILYSFKETPWDDYNHDPSHPALDLLKEHGWTVARTDDTQVFLQRPGSAHRWGAVYHTDTHHLYVFSSSSEFEPEKGYSPTAILATLEHDGDFSAACASLRAKGFGSIFTETEKRAMDRACTLSSEGLSYDDIMRMLNTEYVEIGEESLSAVVKVAEKKTSVKKGIFWHRNKQGTLKLLKPKLADFLTLRGYRLFGQSAADRDKYLVHINTTTRIIREVPIDVMKKDLQAWVYDTDFSEFEVSEGEIRECLFGISAQAWKDIFDWLDVLTVETCPLLRDTRWVSYIPFRNGVVKVTKGDVKMIEYDDLPDGMLIWDTQIKNRDIFIAPIQNDLDLNNSPAYLFLKRIAGLPPSLDHLSFAELTNQHNKEWLRLKSFITTMGYLLSNYKDPERPYAVVLAEDTPDEGKGGGTGKGVFVQMLSHVRNVCTIFGREWKPESDFAYQRVRVSTDIIFLDDTPVRFDFQRLYNVLTEGVAINRKYRDEVMISYSQSPKFVLSTNYDVTAEGDHGKRRQIKLFFHKYFTQDRKPKDEFGKLLFSDEWTDEDWNWYYNVMFFMVQAYYTFGVNQIATTDNMLIKQVRLKYREEFYEFMSELVSNGHDADAALLTDGYTPFDDLYNDFLRGAGLSDKEYSRRRFSYGLEFFCENMGYKMERRMISFGIKKGAKEISIVKK